MEWVPVGFLFGCLGEMWGGFAVESKVAFQGVRARLGDEFRWILGGVSAFDSQWSQEGELLVFWVDSRGNSALSLAGDRTGVFV